MKFLHRIGITVAVMGILVSGLVALVYLFSEARLNRRFYLQPADLPISAKHLSTAEGKRLFISRGCSDCHGDNLAGRVFIDDPLIGTLAGSNLTTGKGGIGGDYEDRDFVSAIRHGLNPQQKPLIYMPSQEYHAMNDAQLGAIIAYIRSVPPVSNNPPLRLGILLRCQFLTGKVPLLPAESIDHQAKPAPALEPEATVAYGEYLANGCRGCHGQNLSGAAVPGAPAHLPKASDLSKTATTGFGKWSEADFFKAIRLGIRPDQSTIDPLMPWQNFRAMTDTEIKALWLYLQSLR